MVIGIDIRNIGKKRTGDETVFLNLVKNLAKISAKGGSACGGDTESCISNNNQYLLFTDTDDNAVLQYIVLNLGIEDKKNFKIISLKTANKFTWNFWTLPSYLRKNPVDVYHTQYILPFFVPKSIKLITHIHDISFNFYPQFIKRSDLFFLKILIPWSIRKADKIIAVSESAKQEIVRYYKTPAEKIEVVYNAAGDNFFQTYSEEQVGLVKKKYSLPEKFLLYIGTFQPRKNIPLLIKAFAGLKDKMPEHRLVLVGSKSAHNFDKDIDKAIDKSDLQDKVIFPGYIDAQDLPAIYRSADIFVFPSLYEGFGIPLLEAFASKTPVCASDIPVFREVAGEGAKYFDPDSLDGLEKVVYNISINPKLREDLTNSGQARIKFFSWEKSAQKMLAVYQGLKN